mgnify:CR=1 FL=1
MTRQTGFTLIEVLVALAIVATALMAGLYASASLTHNAQRQAQRVLAQLCADNALVDVRLRLQLPDVAESVQRCEQGGRTLLTQVRVQATANANFRRLDVRVLEGEVPLLQYVTIVGAE